MKEMPYPDNVGSPRKWTSIYGLPVQVTIEDEVMVGQGTRPYKKLIYLQKIVFSDGAIEYRFTYYMKGFKKGKTKDRWVFGQYSLVTPVKELRVLLAKARRKKWAGF